VNNREPLHGWWSESAYKSNQRLAIYLRPDGSTVAVTAVGTVNPYIGGYRRRRTDAKAILSPHNQKRILADICNTNSRWTLMNGGRKFVIMNSCLTSEILLGLVMTSKEA